MALTLTVLDETTSRLGQRTPALTLICPSDQFTVRELIQARVHQEVQAYNDHQPEYFRGLVQPTDAEQTLNGYRLPPRRFIDPEQQIAKALEAFEQNGFIVLVDDRQAESLDETIKIQPSTSVTFLKLVPLVGG